MACMKLGSKADVFQLEGQSWHCTTGLPSDVCVQVGETSFHLHKFPLLSRSKLLEKVIEKENESETRCVWFLDDLPGGEASFLLVAKFCYDVKLELTAANIVSLICASHYLKMTDDFRDGNLISKTSTFLEQVLNSWGDTLYALQTCEALLPLSEELGVVSRCINSLACKACEERVWPMRVPHSPPTPAVWNGIHSTSEPCSPAGDWWFEHVTMLNFPLFKRLIHAMSFQGMMANRISGCVMFYAIKHLPLHDLTLCDGEERDLVEEIIDLLPDQKGVTPAKFLLKLLKIAMLLDANGSCLENLERRIGAELDRALLHDLLIPNTSSQTDTLYDVECVQRIIDHFLDLLHDDECEVVQDGYDSPNRMTVVASLIDAYLAEVASDYHLKLEDFVMLASSIPDYARSSNDGMYRAIDIYLRAHPWLTEGEREWLCRLMNCRKLSLEASVDAARNEMLPLRVTMQVLFFEQLRLQSCVPACFVNVGRDMDEGDGGAALDEVRERLCRVEKKCEGMKDEIRKAVKSKGRWINFYKRFGLKVRTKSFDLKSPTNNRQGS